MCLQIQYCLIPVVEVHKYTTANMHLLNTIVWSFNSNNFIIKITQGLSVWGKMKMWILVINKNTVSNTKFWHERRLTTWWSWAMLLDLVATKRRNSLQQLEDKHLLKERAFALSFNTVILRKHMQHWENNNNSFTHIMLFFHGFFLHCWEHVICTSLAFYCHPTSLCLHTFRLIWHTILHF